MLQGLQRGLGRRSWGPGAVGNVSSDGHVLESVKTLAFTQDKTGAAQVWSLGDMWLCSGHERDGEREEGRNGDKA